MVVNFSPVFERERICIQLRKCRDLHRKLREQGYVIDGRVERLAERIEELERELSEVRDVKAS